MSGGPFDFGSRPGIPDADLDETPGRPSLADPQVDGPEDEDLDRSLRPQTLSEFVGQRRVREQLRVFIEAACQRGESLDHTLFAGPPGLGKCVTPDTMVFTSNGMGPIGALGELGGDSWQPITKPVAGLYGTRTADWFYDNGESPTLRITTRAGYQLEGTPNHPVLVRTLAAGGATAGLQFRRLDELVVGDEVAVRIGAQVFGSSTLLKLEGVTGPTLSDPAFIPDKLDELLARLLGLMATTARISPKGDGIVVTSSNHRVIEEVTRLCRDVFCLRLDSFGETPLGERVGQRSPRIARALEQLGFSRDGMTAVPSILLRAPRLLVAEYLRGLFWGVEHAPTALFVDRTAVAHVQLMLTNMGIESQIARSDRGWRLSVSQVPATYDPVSIEQAEAAVVGAGHLAADRPVPPSAEQARPVAAPRCLESSGFGMTPAGVLVALDQPITRDGSYRRGSSRSSHIEPVVVRAGERVEVESRSESVSTSATSLSVAEVEPSERGRAITRDRVMASDVRALAVRSVRSELREAEVVELTWEPVEAIEQGRAHTCDVSVPDGHTFIGNGIVCHNTTLASVVAHEMGSTLHQTSGPALEKKADVAAILTSLGPRDVLFIDEIHRLGTAIEEVLYSAMEDFEIDIVLGQGPAARTIRLDLEQFTLIGATTRTGLLTTPLRDRFGMIHRLGYYDAEELAAVVRRSAGLMGLELVEEAAHEIAMRSRGTPRIANRLLRRVRDVAQVRHDGLVTLEIAREALDLVEIDAVGLDRVDRAILEALLLRFAGRPVGLNTLAVAIGEEPHTIEDVYEPFLIQQGFLQRTPRGRVITDLGRFHLSETGVDVSAVASHATTDGPPLF